jgi:hypothetical protein
MLAMGFCFLDYVEAGMRVSELPGVHRIWKNRTIA